MGLLRALSTGVLTYVFSTLMLVQPALAVAFGVGVAFLSESAHHRHDMNNARHEQRHLNRSLNEAKAHIEEMQRMLTRRRVELNKAKEELARRDAIGSPAARELLKRQDEAINAATQALESKQDQNNIVLESMQRLLAAQVEQTASMQHALKDVVGHLMQHPRQQWTMHDSVMVNEHGVPPAPNLASLLAGSGLEEQRSSPTES